MIVNTLSNQRIIKISGRCIFFSPEESLPLDQTTLDPEKMRFRPGREFYWLTEIVSYNPSGAGLLLRVIDYVTDDITGFQQQKVRHPIRFVSFESLDWMQLEPQLAFYQYNQILNILEEAGTFQTEPDGKVRQQESEGFPAVGSVSVHEAYVPGEENLFPATDTRIIDEIFKYPFTDAVFDTGCVRVVKTFPWYAEPVTITLENSSILPEFDLIKSFFHKVFDGRRKFTITASIELSGNAISRISAASPEIARIDETLIEGVKRAQVLQYIRKQPAVTDKSLFTADEFMSHYADDEEVGNALKQSEMDILLAAMGRQELRNRRQIEYLAGKLHSPEQKIRFTLKPNFGFVFFYEGETMNHFCWELLNSHATYLWSFGRAGETAAQQYRKVETIITSIRETGREQYKSSYHSLPSDPNMHFSIVTHRNANSGLIDGFPEWKHRLLERLV